MTRGTLDSALASLLSAVAILIGAVLVLAFLAGSVYSVVQVGGGWF